MNRKIRQFFFVYLIYLKRKDTAKRMKELEKKEIEKKTTEKQLTFNEFD